MTRRKRDEGVGAIHHVIPQGNGRKCIVVDDQDRFAYLARFDRVREELDWTTHASCLMETHHHAIVETAEPNLGRGVQRVLGGHARRLNQRHGWEGSVFRQHFWSRRIVDDAWLLQACLYVVLNPVAAGLCAHPRAWRWSSYEATAHGDPTRYERGEERLLGMFGRTPREARQRYAEVVDEAAEVVIARRLADGAGVWRALGAFRSDERLAVPERPVSD